MMFEHNKAAVREDSGFIFMTSLKICHTRLH